MKVMIDGYVTVTPEDIQESDNTEQFKRSLSVTFPGTDFKGNVKIEIFTSDGRELDIAPVELSFDDFLIFAGNLAAMAELYKIMYNSRTAQITWPTMQPAQSPMLPDVYWTGGGLQT